MSDDIVITVPGEPIAAGRPRFTRTGIAYTPERTRSEQAILRDAAEQQMNGRLPLEGPLEVIFHADRSVPTSWSRKRQDQALLGIRQPITRPDADNLLKMLDALTHIVWRDDAQIVRLFFEKRYSAKPMTVITVRPWQHPSLAFPSDGSDDD